MNQLQKEEYMQRAIELAKNGIHSCKPNPRVGCVIVKNDIVIGEGWHKKTAVSYTHLTLPTIYSV